MKLVQFFSLVLLTIVISCKDAPERPEPMLDEGYEPTSNQASSPLTTTTTTNANVGSSVYHYACPNGCGGGDAAGTCPTCGTEYTHNQAFHNQAGAETTANPIGNVTTTTPSPPTQATEPPQNAAGVWHYTCPSGCEGGGGSAVACAGCGTTLVHNTLYHQ